MTTLLGINDLPKTIWIDYKGKKQEVGLCCKVSPKYKKWICGYGTDRTINSQNVGVGDTPIEAWFAFLKIWQKTV